MAKSDSDFEARQEFKRRLLDAKRKEARKIVELTMGLFNDRINPPPTITYRDARLTFENMLWLIATDPEMVDDAAVPVFQRGLVENPGQFSGQVFTLRDGLLTEKMIQAPVRPRGMAA